MIRRGLIATTGLVLVAAVTVGVSRLKPAAPGVDRRTLWLDKVKRGPMLREVRGVGTLVSEDILWVPAVVPGRVVRVLVEPGTAVEPNTILLELLFNINQSLDERRRPAKELFNIVPRQDCASCFRKHSYLSQFW